MSNHATQDEKSIMMDMTYDYIVNKGMSIRKCAEEISKDYKKVSYVTISNYLKEIKKINGMKGEEIDNILSSHKPKTISNEEVRKRVRTVVVSLKAGYSFEEISTMLHESLFTVYRDFTTRLNLLTEEELELLDITKEDIEKIKQELDYRRKSNLRNSSKK